MEHQNRRIRVLIGGLSRTTRGAVSTITQELIDGLDARYDIVPHYANRMHGQSKHAKLNLLNLIYLVKHFLLWILLLLKHRPHIAHYPITSYWNMEKSLAFLMAARLLGSQTVAHLHGGAFLDFWRSLPPWRKRFALKELQKTDALVVLSDGWKAKIVNELRLPKHRIHVVHNLLERRTEAALLDMPIPHLSNRVLCLGVMSSEKGIWDILEASEIASRRISFKVDIVGPDREPDASKRCNLWIQKHTLSSTIKVHGAVWRRDLKIDLFENAAMLVLPSHHENLPLVVMEAAAAGLPVIATPVGALPEFFRHGVSILFVEQGDVKEIAQMIEQLMLDPDLRRRLGSAARTVFKDVFNRKSILSSLETVYQTVLAGQS